MPFHFQGKTFEAVQREKMTPGEIDEVERITGVTYKRISFMASKCVCGHPAQAHLHYDVEGDGRLNADDYSCAEVGGCECLSFDADLPALVQYAFLFIAAKRNDPATSWDTIRDLPQDAWSYEREADENPTPPSAQEG